MTDEETRRSRIRSVRSTSEDRDGLMWLVSLRDLQWRRRRFAIAVAGTSLVFSMTLLLAGLSAGVRNEARRVVYGLGADSWVFPKDVSGPFTSVSLIAGERLSEIKGAEGVEAAEPIVIIHQLVRHGDELIDTNVFGIIWGGMAQPEPLAGRVPQASGEALVDEKLGTELGEEFDVGTVRFRTVGLVRRWTYFGGQPVVFVSIKDAQALVFRGFPFATAALLRGRPKAVPADLKVVGNEEVRADIVRPIGNAMRTIDIIQVLLWIVAASIIGSIVYISSLERTRDFAVFKATGSSNASLAAGLAVQAVIVSLTSAALAIVLARALGPLFPLPVEIPAAAIIALPGVAVAVGFIASLSGLRRAVSADPALAFGGP